MEHRRYFWLGSAKRFAYLFVTAAAGSYVLFIMTPLMAATDKSSAPAWARPNAMAIRRSSLLTGSQHEQTLLNNLDCDVLSFRVPDSDMQQSGCYAGTIFGLMDSDTGNIIFGGTDEALPLIPFAPHQLLAPWPGTMALISLDPASTGGSYISLYRNPLLAVRDQRNVIGGLQAKQLIVPPDLPLKDPAGQRLVINPQTLAFSSTGSWMVVETLTGSFVRVNLATLDMTPFAPAFGTNGSPGLLKSRVAASDDGRFVAIMNNDAASFKVYDLATCEASDNNLRTQNCQSYDYNSFVHGQISGLQSIRHLRFINDGLMSFEAITSSQTTTGTYELAPAAAINSLTDYIGLGDSYTSGEGAFDYLESTDSTNNLCHLSRRSYPLLLTDQLFSAAGGHSVACSGAVINDVGSTAESYRGQVRGVANLHDLQQNQPLLLEAVETNFVPGYIAQQRFVKRWQPRIVTVSVGGDDIGFGDLVQTCVEPHLGRHLSDHTCFNTYEDRLELQKLIDRTIPRWTALYRQLQQEAPDSRLYAIGYPQLFDDTGSCALNVKLNKSELEFAASIIDYLNQDIHKAADAAGTVYVDISQALAGHRLCETASYNVAANGLTAGRDGGPLGTKLFGKESYHPNMLGQALIEQAILEKTHNLTDIAASKLAAANSAALLNAPRTGRIVNNRVPDPALTDRVGKPGSSLAVRSTGVHSGLRSQTVYTIRFDGPGGTVLGTVTSDMLGDIDASVTIPASTLPGGHTIDITGENQAGETVDVTQPIIVPSSEADSDGDDAPDVTDTCPGVFNSTQDIDRDGIDDTCDPLIGLPPMPASGGSATGNSTGNGSPQTSKAEGVLMPATPTIVTSFAVQQNATAIQLPVGNASRHVDPQKPVVLGVATVTPRRAQNPHLIQGQQLADRGAGGPLGTPPVISWKFLLWLLAVSWLLLVLAGVCLRQAVRQEQPAPMSIKSGGYGIQ